MKTICFILLTGYYTNLPIYINKSTVIAVSNHPDSLTLVRVSVNGENQSTLAVKEPANKVISKINATGCEQ